MSADMGSVGPKSFPIQNFREQHVWSCCMTQIMLNNTPIVSANAPHIGANAIYKFLISCNGFLAFEGFELFQLGL